MTTPYSRGFGGGGVVGPPTAVRGGSGATSVRLGLNRFRSAIEPGAGALGRAVVGGAVGGASATVALDSSVGAACRAVCHAWTRWTARDPAPTPRTTFT